MLTFGEKASGIVLIQSIKICGYEYQDGHNCDCDFCNIREDGGIHCCHCNRLLIKERDYHKMKGDEEVEKYLEKGCNRICPSCKYYLDNDDRTIERIKQEYGITSNDF